MEGIECGVVDFSVYAMKKSFITLIRETFYDCFSTVKIILESLKDLVTGKYGLEAVSGPVGTVGVIADTAKLGFSSLAYLFVFVSMNLGVFNLLPIPALDGGRLVFVIIEAIRRRPVKPEHEGWVHLGGMALLMLLMIVVTFKDVIKLF